MSDAPRGKKAVVPLTASQLELLDDALQALAAKHIWPPVMIDELSGLFARHQRSLRR